MTQIVATAAIPPAGHLAFSSLGPIEQIDGPGRLGEAEVLLVRAETIRGAELDRAPRLRIIARTGSGYDNVDVASATARGVPVVFVPAEGARPIAEGTMTLILAASKRLGELGALAHAGRWAKRYTVEGLDLNDSILGIVGLGQIGREVARLASAFGMQVLAFDPNLRESKSDDIPLLPLTELVARVDVLSLHCPLTPKTRGLVDQDLLNSMKPGAVLVNTARGEIIADEELLNAALDDGRLSAVALDVFREEPLPASSPLLRDPRIICTPHSIGLTQRWNESVFSSLAVDVSRFLRGVSPLNVVDRAALDQSRARRP
jgi:D-3-phosphoglycerate dehydrogenase